MNWSSPQAIETKIKRLEREIEEIDRYFYEGNKTEDRELYAGMLERKRDDIVRAAVLQMHTGIEDMLTSIIIHRILGATSQTRKRKLGTTAGKALRKVLFGAGSMGFDMKLNFAVALRIIDMQTKSRLMELNTLRNKCSHNWLLKSPVRHGRRPKQKKSPLLLYCGRDLHTVAAIKDFAGEFGGIYGKMFLKLVD